MSAALLDMPSISAAPPKNEILAGIVGGIFYIGTYFYFPAVPNPMNQEAIIAVAMVAPIVCGMTCGHASGLISGLLGTAAVATLTYSPWETLGIPGHTLMGFLAGYLTERFSPWVGVLSLAVGHLVNITLYAAVNQMGWCELLAWSDVNWFLLATEFLLGAFFCMLCFFMYILMFRSVMTEES